MHLVNEGREALRQAIRELAVSEAIRTGIRWVASPTVGSQTYEDLKDSVKTAKVTGYLPVWDVAADTSVYGNPGVVEFRYWHDMGHVEHGLSFVFGEEVALQKNVQIGQVSRALDRQGLNFEVKEFALKLLWANTIGQLEWGRKFGGFPADQNAFDIDYACGLWDHIREVRA